MNDPDRVVGDRSALPFPVSVEALREAGADFLTAAFRWTGALAQDNRVTAITGFTEFFGGGMGRKVSLSVAYARDDPGLHTHLFVKFTRDFGDPLRELFGPLMEPEVRFALLSRRSGFPVAVPTCYFADYHAATTTGILITERIEYGENGIEPRHDKCLDDELDNPVEHYRALTKAMARLAAYHKAGNFGLETQQAFPFDAQHIDPGSRIPYTPEQLQAKLAKLLDFVAQAPQLFPEHLRNSGFLNQFVNEAPFVLEHELAIRAALNASADHIALCHWNMNLDNAWFWRDARGELQAGLLDWGSVGQMNVAQAFYGMTCAAEAGFLHAHRRDLLALFVDEYRRGGGPAIDLDELAQLVRLAVAVLGIAWILDAPALIEREIGAIRAIEGRHDPALRNNFLARAQLQLLVVFLSEWQDDQIGAALREFARRAPEDRQASAAQAV
ncbi:hypothetical protein C7401_114125 [Paraburkholderia unamae]|uniref:hypothetical protein n=1 Tax=Paraburkholderia unamae TaxID=219649 RepID=UPI000DC42CDF|nr:hypothetical protein [Paraburkholderia unamae]RAR57906.1 hypothetical protein C7401_114125 [Paraburkholderia unamae]